METILILIIIAAVIGLYSYFNYKLVNLREDNEKLQIKNKQLMNEIVEIRRAPVINTEELMKQAMVEVQEKVKEEEAHIRKEHEHTVNLMREKLAEDLRKAQEEMTTLLNVETVKTQGVIAAQKEVQEKRQKEIDAFKCSIDALIESSRRAESEEMKHGFYMIQFTAEDLEELKELQSIANRYGRIAVPLRKAVWEIYYQKRVKDMINRVVGTGRVSGIYKITNIKNNRTYIGQAVDIGSRWTTHIKRVLGVETETTNKLYPAMRNEGLENFTFEIVEATDDLKNREAYWQEFYKVKEWGYNVRGEKAD